MIYNSQKENIYKRLKNKKQYPKIKNVNESNISKKNQTIEKQNCNISEEPQNKRIKKIKNILTANKTFNSRNTPLNNNKINPFNLNSMNKTKLFLESLAKINNKIKLNQGKTNSEKTMEKTLHNNNSGMKLSDYSIYLPNEILDLSFYKKMCLNFPKSKDFLNTKFHNLKKLSFLQNKKSKIILSKSSSDTNIITNNKAKNLCEYSKKYVNIYNPRKLLQYNNKNNKSEDPPPIIMKNDLEKNIIIKNKTKENKSILKEKDVKKESLELRLSQCIKNTNIDNFKNNSTNIFKKDSLKSDNKNNTINVFRTPKVTVKINNEPKKEIIIHCSSKFEAPELVRTNIPNNKIENGGLIDTNNNNRNNSSNTLIYRTKQKNLKEEIIIRKSRFKSVVNIKSFNLNQNSINKKKIKFLNIFPIKENEINKENKSFLDKIKIINDCDSKMRLQKVKIKKIKKLILNKQKKIIDNIIFDNKDNLRLHQSLFEFNNMQELENYYNHYLRGNDMNDNYEKIDNELKYISTIFIIFHGYISHVNKCTLDENTINYILLNNSLSSLYVSLIDFTKKRCSVFMKGKLFIIKNTTYFEDKKSKFIESKKLKQIFENTYSHFIYKEFSALYLNSDNKDFLKDNKENTIKKDNKVKYQRRQIKSYTRKMKDIPVKRFILRQSLSCKKISHFNKLNTFYKYKNKIDNLSVLQKGKIFESPKKYKYINIKNIRRTSTLLNENHYRRASIRNSLSYYDLIKSIKGKNKYITVLTNLLKEREIYLFIEYANSNSRNIDLNYQDNDGNTFLILSIRHGLNKLTKFLLEKGCNVNIQNKEGNSALHYALSGKNFVMADLLRKYGALENTVNKLGYTPWDSIGKNIELEALY